MLDIKFIRENSKIVKEGCQKKQVNVDIDRILEVDKKRREALRALEDMRAQKNKASKEISTATDEKEKQKIILKMQELDKGSDRFNREMKELDEEFEKLMQQIPNLPQDDVPVGKDEKANLVLKEWGKKTEFCFKPKDYLEIAESLDIIDVKRAAKVSGSRFGYLKNEAVLLEFALINLAFDVLTKERFIPILPPVLIKPPMMKAMGYVDTEADLKERYFLEKDNLFLVGTGEQSIGPMHQDEIFQEKEIPKRYVGFSTCFREEAGSYGKDTKGILRVHQFDKVEMFSFCKPEESSKEHKFLLGIEEKLMQLLKIPYRVAHLSTGDMARPSASTFDIEAWLPGQNQYRETHSVSNCTDFQARRLNIRHRAKDDKSDFVHTLNGTAFAIGRTIIAIIENYQQKDGTIKIPKALQKFMGGKKIIKRS